MTGAGDPAAAEALRGALAQWTMFARDAELAAQRRQRATSLDLLHSARQIALGVDAVKRLTEEHHRQTQVLRGARTSAWDAADRLERRLEALRQLAAAAVRAKESIDAETARSAEHLSALHPLRSEADSIIAETAEAVERTAAAHRSAVGVAERSVRSWQRLEETGKAIEELRQRFEQLGRQAADALESMRVAGDHLAVSQSLYEQAQLRSVDLRRDTLPPPTGAPLQPPRAEPPPPMVPAP